MRSVIGSLLVLALVTVLAPAAHAGRSFQIVPQVGITGATLSSAPESLSTSAKIGWMLGGSLRFGSRPYFQPGVFYQQTSLDASAPSDISGDIVDAELGLGSWWVPVLVGFNVINGEQLDLHLHAGPSATIVSSVKDNPYGVTKDDYESMWWGAVVGAGVDISLISIDVSYEFGLSKILKDDPGSDTKQNVARLTAGLRF
jgi:hypothetical protein